MQHVVLIEDHGERTWVAADTREQAMQVYVRDVDGDLVGISVGLVVIAALPSDFLLNIDRQTRSCGEWAAQCAEPTVLTSTLIAKEAKR